MKLQSPHVLSSPENIGGFPILASMIPRPCKSCRWWYIGSLRWFHWRYGQELFPLSASALFPIVKECPHHLCLCLPLGLSLSPLLSCHVHDSPSTRFHLPSQRQLRYHVNEDNQNGSTRVQSRCQSAVKQTWKTCG